MDVNVEAASNQLEASPGGQIHLSSTTLAWSAAVPVNPSCRRAKYKATKVTFPLKVGAVIGKVRSVGLTKNVASWKFKKKTGLLKIGASPVREKKREAPIARKMGTVASDDGIGRRYRGGRRRREVEAALTFL
ncbi:unnamed protein product [Linum trigynum]|uniref:Uncharacterized protein n=1 Tax=Linum trigynum TaxID=586398 RepID=A0AAV2DAS8_9ROSI